MTGGQEELKVDINRPWPTGDLPKELISAITAGQSEFVEKMTRQIDNWKPSRHWLESRLKIFVMSSVASSRWHDGRRSDMTIRDLTRRTGDTTRHGSHPSGVRDAVGSSGSPIEPWRRRERRAQHRRGEATEVYRTRMLVQHQREIFVRMAAHQRRFTLLKTTHCQKVERSCAAAATDGWDLAALRRKRPWGGSSIA
jgi:hypothetical protein